MARSIWNGAISFGLLNIPVDLHTAEDTGGQLHFHLLDERDLSPVRYKRINTKSGKEVPYEKIVKGYEYEKGRFVVLEQEDFRAANVKASQTIDIENFVPLENIDPLLFEKPYYLAPQKSGTKGYSLLRDALRKSGRVAVGKIVIRTRQHLAIVMPKDEYLILEILRFAHEVKEIREVHYLDKVDVSSKVYSANELKMATQLIDGMTVDWEPDQYKDTYYQDLRKRIDSKLKKGPRKMLEPEEEITPTSNVVDLLPLLKRSLAEAKTNRGKSAPRKKKKSSSGSSRKAAK